MPRFHAGLLALVVFGCSSEPAVEGPKTFGEFYEELQDKRCPLATGSCVGALEDLSCQFRDTVPACTAYDPQLAELCLEAETTCVEGRLETPDRACASVCADTSFDVVGSIQPPECAAMLACDAAMPAPFPFFEGENDPGYGPDGTCYEGDMEACIDACRSMIDSIYLNLETEFMLGLATSIPQECRDAAVYLDPPPPPFAFRVLLDDQNTTTTWGGDRIELTSEGSFLEHPEVRYWSVGFHSQWNIVDQGEVLYGDESCRSRVAPTGLCHLLPSDSTRALRNPPTFNAAAVGGEYSLFWVHSNPPPTDWVFRGLDNDYQEVVCYATSGHASASSLWPECEFIEVEVTLAD